MLIAASESMEWLLSIIGASVAALLIFLVALAAIRYAHSQDDRRSSGDQRR
ncbi:MAG: hypothetical protein ACPHCI_04330 [Solirubrobacterales bacterium]